MVADDKKPKTKKEQEEERKRQEEEEKKKKEEEAKPKKEPALIHFETIRDHLNALEKGEAHVLGRIMQVLHKTRKNLSLEILHRILLLHSSGLSRDELVALLPPRPEPVPQATPMEVDGATPEATAATAAAPVVLKLSDQPLPSRKKTTSPPIESDAYIHLLVLLYLVDAKELDAAHRAANSLIARVDQNERRSLDPIAAKALFYLALIFERKGSLNLLRSYLNARLRAATLKRYTETQATLIYTLLRTFLISRQYLSAAKLVSKVTFPEGASNNDLARFLYYQGRIKAMQLDYAAASGYFLQAMRKAPQEAAIGFKQNAQKWVVVVGLLQGEIPIRSVFRQPIYRRCLQPYLELTQAVRMGDLLKFNAVVQKYGQSVFEKDETQTLIVRLRQNVIKTAVKQISLAYSRISITDICKKLQLASEVETEYMVAKAISDGSIEASVTCGEPNSNEAGLRFMQSAEIADIYRSSEPQSHFDSRIRYCLELHNQAVKALRFPPKSATEIETIEQQRDRERRELEFAKGMAEDDDDDF